MKLSIKREYLLNAIKALQCVVSGSAVKEILSCVMLEIRESKVYLRGTDLELAIEVTLDGINTEDGNCVIGLDRLEKIVVGARSEMVDFEKQDNSLKVSAGAKLSLLTVQSDEFPDFGKIEFTSVNPIIVNYEDFCEAIRYGKLSLPKANLKLTGIGIQITIIDSKLVICSTDMKRVSECRINIEPMDRELPEVGAVFPLKTLAALSALWAAPNDNSNKISLDFTEQGLTARSGFFTFKSKALTSKMLEYWKRIPPTNKKFTVNTSEFLSALRQVSSVSDGELLRTKFMFTKTSLAPLTITAQSPNIGTAEVMVDGQYEGDDLEIGFNIHYIIPILEAAKTPTLEVCMSESGHPMQIRNDNLFFLSMPLQL